MGQFDSDEGKKIQAKNDLNACFYICDDTTFQIDSRFSVTLGRW